MNRIISYRGLIADGGQDTINLHTNDGKTGYKVVKFETISNQNTAGGVGGEHFMQIWKVKQTSVSTTTPNIDFNNNKLLAVNWSPNNAERSFAKSIIFDNEIFNQDIYVTHMDISGAEKCNYYIELEQIDLTEDQALVAIVKNLRNEQ